MKNVNNFLKIFKALDSKQKTSKRADTLLEVNYLYTKNAKKKECSKKIEQSPKNSQNLIFLLYTLGGCQLTPLRTG